VGGLVGGGGGEGAATAAAAEGDSKAMVAIARQGD